MSYKDAGVDINAAVNISSRIGTIAKSTFNKRVLSHVGNFGGLFSLIKLKEKNPILVASVDGVGTKVQLARTMNIFNTIGQDLVNHCVDDIAVQGARPLFFLDYIALSTFNAHCITGVIDGIAKACKQNGCVLIGGETAEMPGVYRRGEYDLAGSIVGIVDKNALITGTAIAPGDCLIGLASSGLHTNGYSLALKAVKRGKLNLKRKYTGLRKTLGMELLKPHISYLSFIQKAGRYVHGFAHITGGGFDYNISRILPNGTAAMIDIQAWKTPRIFTLLQEAGIIAQREMYSVFNMGIGMIAIAPPRQAARIIQTAHATGHRAWEIGTIINASARANVRKNGLTTGMVHLKGLAHD